MLKWRGDDGKDHRVQEHRWLLERAGFNVDDMFVVHLDGNGHNNSLDNLGIFTRAEHGKFRRDRDDTYKGLGGKHWQRRRKMRLRAEKLALEAGDPFEEVLKTIVANGNNTEIFKKVQDVVDGDDPDCSMLAREMVAIWDIKHDVCDPAEFLEWVTRMCLRPE